MRVVFCYELAVVRVCARWHVYYNVCHTHAVRSVSGCSSSFMSMFRKMLPCLPKFQRQCFMSLLVPALLFIHCVTLGTKVAVVHVRASTPLFPSPTTITTPSPSARHVCLFPLAVLCWAAPRVGTIGTSARPARSRHVPMTTECPRTVVYRETWKHRAEISLAVLGTQMVQSAGVCLWTCTVEALISSKAC